MNLQELSINEDRFVAIEQQIRELTNRIIELEQRRQNV